MMDELKATLGGIVGATHIFECPADLLPKDWNRVSAVSASPESVEQITEIVRAVQLAGAAIIPVGGGNLLHAAAPPPSNRPHVLLSLHRMNQVLDHQPDDMTVTCQAGCTIEQLDAAIAVKRQMLALDSPMPHTSTLGGLVATASPGLRRYAYGAPRDQLIGVKAVMSGGVAITGGGKVVKNVAGYDVCKLLTGSWGSVGIITETTFRVRPMPETRRTIAWRTPSLQAAAMAGLLLHQARLNPTFVMAANSWSGSSALIIGIDGTEQRVNWQAEQFAKQARAAGTTSEMVTLTDDETAQLQSAPAVSAEGAAASLRFSILPTELEAWTTYCERSLEELVHFQADCALGTGSLTIGPCKNFLSQYRSIVAALPGGATCHWNLLPSGDADLSTVDRFGGRREDYRLQHALKTAIDPSNTFSPGRFPG